MLHLFILLLDLDFRHSSQWMPPLALFPRHRFIFCVSLGIGIKVGHTIVHPFEADDDKASLHHEKLVLLEDEGVELVAVDFVVFDVEVLLEKALPEYGDLLICLGL